MNRNEQLFEFIENSPTALHAASEICRRLREYGYTELYENEVWNIAECGKYFVCRGGSSVIAFSLPSGFRAFNIMATHTDSPCFKLKAETITESCGAYARFNTEKYGGAILPSWLDRPLSLAGRITRRTADGVVSELWDAGYDLCVIPSIAPHQDTGNSAGKALDMKTDMLPLIGVAGTELSDIIDTEGMLACDLYLYNRQSPAVYGANGEFIASARLDDLQCTFSALTGLLESAPTDNAAVFCAFDNEEVGSATKQGADSNFLESVLTRICESAGMSRSAYYQALASSFMMSADNAHAPHPNHPELSDPQNSPKMNGGIVIKYNANQKYTTDSVSASVTAAICERAGVPYQSYANRSDKPGGSTLGGIAATHVSVMSADIGLAQLAMHSAYESAGSADTEYFCIFAKEFYNTTIKTHKNGKVILE